MKKNHVDSDHKLHKKSAVSLSMDLTEQKIERLSSNSNENCERDFSIELESSKHLNRLLTSNSSYGGVLIEGTIGKLRRASFVEPEIFEVKGEFGVLRLNLQKNEIKAATRAENPKNQESAVKEVNSHESR
jgi:hypothetical protein